MQTLHLKDNYLRIIENFNSLGNLTTLNVIGSPYLDAIPGSIFQSTRLKSINFSGNKLNKIDSTITGLDSLIYLNLNDNKIAKLPSGFNQMNDLHFLMVKNNELKEIPLPIKGTNLKHLNISNNQLGFEYLEPLFSDTAQSIVNTLLYIPQQNKGSNYIIQRKKIDKDTLNSFTGGNYTNYQWQKLAENDWLNLDNKNDSLLLFDAFTEADSGLYRCKITNDIIPDLILISDTVKVEIILSDDVFAIRSGYFNNPANWSYTNDGPPLNRQVNKNDIVNISGFEITVNSNLECKSVIIDNQESSGLIVDGSQIEIYGNVHLKSTNSKNKANIKVLNNGKLVTNQPID